MMGAISRHEYASMIASTMLSSSPADTLGQV
jgi:hypothetical protein